MDTTIRSITIPAMDSLQLAADIIMPVNNQVIGTILVHPATGLTKKFYLKFARYMAGESYRVIIYDYRGMGDSRNSKLRNVKCSMLDWALLDMNGVLNFAVEYFSSQPIYWVGHSIGGQFMALMDRYDCITKVIAINSSTGYWKSFRFPFNLYSLFLWKVFLPLSIPLLGYGPISRYGLGQDIPAGAARQWARWCCDPDHFAETLRQESGRFDFSHFNVPITAFGSSDDFIATSDNIDRLLSFYPSSPRKKIMVSPEQAGVYRIAHTGFFRSGPGGKIWPLILREIEHDDRNAGETLPLIHVGEPAIRFT
ncbi:alpha/beta fold hydrolase [Flavihumibacter solisilvae]|uniref:Serine aminopeptidase S33 domain-containing protein n=1 Tax=Flavihumibacter solisilvae TaxID=1349421 RepID=A0A0C1IYN0_9BACT|nr:alpha/beta fold hydrolase [Flavihumibacter solisilvae]KIC95579.1 hypothetical protein OI18_04770 [Flavihumibacter solisilvae]